MWRSKWKQWVKSLKRNTYALYLASQDSRVPLGAKIVIVLVVAYALSPIDLIPDFIPVLGYLDDMLLLPLGIWLAIKLMPNAVWAEIQARAQQEVSSLPRNWKAAAVVITIWMVMLVGLGLWLVSLVPAVKST